MKSKKQKQEEALKRRKLELAFHERQKPVVEEDDADKALNQARGVSIKRARDDIAALERKLGILPSGFITTPLKHSSEY